jgi:predicted transcriptional regulator
MIGNFTSHTAADCTDDGHNLRETIAMPAGNRYFLVVPLTTGSEGSYGTDSAGNERPRGTAACRATQGPSACP